MPNRPPSYTSEDYNNRSDEQSPLLYPAYGKKNSRPNQSIMVIVLPILLFTTTICGMLYLLHVTSSAGESIRICDPDFPPQMEEVCRKWDGELARFRAERDVLQRQVASLTVSVQRKAEEKRELQGKVDHLTRAVLHEEQELRSIQRRIEDNKEAIRREDEARKNLLLYWSTPVFQDHCLWYGSRELSAQLMNLPEEGFDNMRACHKTPLEVNGVTLNSPTRCEETADGVYGHWKLTNDAVCKPWWSGLNNKGCSERGSGYRRYEQRLENLQDRDDWRQMCETTPADFNGMHFNGPHYCADWGQHGIFGVWIVRDDSCR